MLDDHVYGIVGEIGDAETFSKSYFGRIVRLALLALDVGDAILAGQTDELEWPPPASWEEQRARILEPKPSLAV